MDSCWPSRLETEEDALAAKSVFSQPESQLTTDTGPGRSVHTHTHYTTLDTAGVIHVHIQKQPSDIRKPSS